jgi:hypothetical protein
VAAVSAPGDWQSFADVLERVVTRGAMIAWAGRQFPGALPPPISSPVPSRGPPICAWCFEPLGEMRSEFNGGTGHPECARFAYDAVAGDDPMPWPIPEPHRHDPLVPFCRRLGREAARMGIDTQKLAQAIGRARCA